MYKSLNLLIGKKTKDSYYVCEKGSRNVYTMSSDTIEKITKLDAYTNMDHCVYSVLATSIKGYDVTYGNTTLSVTRKTVKRILQRQLQHRLLRQPKAELQLIMQRIAV